MDQPSKLAVGVLRAAKLWLHTRLALRRILDSKRATAAAVERAKQNYTKASEELEQAVLKLDRVLNGKSPKTPGAAFPWRELIRMVAAGAHAVENALDKSQQPLQATVVSSKVIDMEPDA